MVRAHPQENCQEDYLSIHYQVQSFQPGSILEIQMDGGTRQEATTELCLAHGADIQLCRDRRKQAEG